MVISTYVEMIPTLTVPPPFQVGDLHVCGDDPKVAVEKGIKDMVISTYVEMILWFQEASQVLRGDLHVCGDDPPLHTTVRFF